MRHGAADPPRGESQVLAGKQSFGRLDHPGNLSIGHNFTCRDLADKFPDPDEKGLFIRYGAEFICCHTVMLSAHLCLSRCAAKTTDFHLPQCYNRGVAPSTDTANRQIARAAGLVMAAFVLSNITGLVRQILVSQVFGTSGDIDAFNAAARLPELLFSLVAGGALASAFVPTFTGFLTRKNRRGAWELASAVLTCSSCC